MLRALQAESLYSCATEPHSEMLSVPTDQSWGWTGGGRKLKWSKSGIGGGGTGAHPTWQATIDELAKAPSGRLFPFVKVCCSARECPGILVTALECFGTATKHCTSKRWMAESAKAPHITWQAAIGSPLVMIFCKPA